MALAFVRGAFQLISLCMLHAIEPSCAYFHWLANRELRCACRGARCLLPLPSPLLLPQDTIFVTAMIFMCYYE